MTGACLCGAVRVTIDTTPDFVNDCNCTLCRKVGAAWSYFGSASVAVHGETAGFVRADKPNAGVAVQSCATCGATTHFVLTEDFRRQHPTADVVGVNMRLFDPDALAGVEVRFPDGKAWSGEGPYGFRRAPLKLDADTRW
jgi:hypothetical protein